MKKLLILAPLAVLLLTGASRTPMYNSYLQTSLDGNGKDITNVNRVTATTFTSPGAGVGSEKFGTNSAAAGSGAAAFGTNASAAGQEAVSFGKNTTAGGAGGIAIGGDATATQPGSIVLGHSGISLANGAMAIGPAATVGTGSDYGVAIGDDARVDDAHANSVAIGHESITDDENQIMLGTAIHTVKIPGSLTVDGNIVGNVKTYVARLTQASTAAPVATVLVNTLGDTVAWARSDVGRYTATLASVFTANKTTVNVKCATTAEGPSRADFQHTSTSVISVTTGDGGAYADDVLASGSWIEILVYP